MFLLSSYLHPILLFNTLFYYLHFVLKHLKVSGLSKWFATKLALMDDLEPWVLNLVLCLIMSGLTEFISNPAVNNLMMPILSSLVRTPHVYVACPKSPVTHTFYSEHISGTNQSYSCRIIGRIGTYFTEQHVAHFNGLTATVTLVTMHRHDRSRSNYAKCFRNFHFSQSAKSI